MLLSILLTALLCLPVKRELISDTVDIVYFSLSSHFIHWFFSLGFVVFTVGSLPHLVVLFLAIIVLFLDVSHSYICCQA